MVVVVFVFTCLMVSCFFVVFTVPAFDVVVFQVDTFFMTGVSILFAATEGPSIVVEFFIKSIGSTLYFRIKSWFNPEI